MLEFTFESCGLMWVNVPEAEVVVHWCGVLEILIQKDMIGRKHITITSRERSKSLIRKSRFSCLFHAHLTILSPPKYISHYELVSIVGYDVHPNLY